MAGKVCIALVLGVAALGVRAEPEAENPANPCPSGAVRFEGQVTFEENQKPMQLSKATVLTIDVAEEAPSGEAPKAAISSHDVTLENYSLEKEITYGFCADLSNLSAKKVSLKAHIIDQAEDDKVEYIGETVVTAGSDTYEADITLAKLETGTVGANPSVADCQFGEMAEDVTGVAIKASVKLNAKTPLPKPTYLAVTLNEVSSDNEEPEVISLFAGDVSSLYEPGKPVTAFLCAKVPVTEEATNYALEATVHMGWDGFESPDSEDRTPRKGDFVSPKDTPVVFVQGQSDYSVEVEVVPFEAGA